VFAEILPPTLFLRNEKYLNNFLQISICLGGGK